MGYPYFWKHPYNWGNSHKDFFKCIFSLLRSHGSQEYEVEWNQDPHVYWLVNDGILIMVYEIPLYNPTNHFFQFIWGEKKYSKTGKYWIICNTNLILVLSNRIKYTFLVIKSEKWLFKFLLDSNSKSETKEHRRDDILAGLTFPINITAVSGTTFKEKSHNAWSSGAVLKSCTRSRLLCKSPSALGLDRRTTLPSAETRPAQRHRSKFVASKQYPSTKLEHSVAMGPTPWFC